MAAERSLELSVPARAEYIAVVRLVVSSLAIARRALADERIDDLKLAVSEACTNAFEANVSVGRADAPVTVSCAEAPDRFEVSVTDAGPGFDPDQLPPHPPVTDPDRLNFERGLGIPLIRSLVDDVRFEPGIEGTTVTMTLYGGPEYGDETTEIVRTVIADQG
jgi:serine/threonine-protein kinase RsbW